MCDNNILSKKCFTSGESSVGQSLLQRHQDQLIELMDTRWNGTFDLIGKTLLRKQ